MRSDDFYDWPVQDMFDSVYTLSIYKDQPRRAIELCTLSEGGRKPPALYEVESSVAIEIRYAGSTTKDASVEAAPNPPIIEYFKSIQYLQPYV